jgi:hypothetical protein
MLGAGGRCRWPRPDVGLSHGPVPDGRNQQRVAGHDAAGSAGRCTQLSDTQRLIAPKISAKRASAQTPLSAYSPLVFLYCAMNACANTMFYKKNWGSICFWRKSTHHDADFCSRVLTRAATASPSSKCWARSRCTPSIWLALITLPASKNSQSSSAQTLR